jgi:hypothetical protein
MATSAPQSGQPVQVAGGGSQIQDIAGLLATLLGTSQTQTQTSSPGDTAALQALLGQLQGADYSALLQSIFQQAGGQIPGMQQAMGNAIGARSGGNSAVNAALQQLMQQTAIAGTQAVTNAQLQNQQLQAQAGNAVANATKGTQQQATTKTPGMGKDLAGLVALLKLGQAVTGTKDLEGLAGAVGLGSKTATAKPAQPTAPVAGPTGGVTSVQGPAPIQISTASIFAHPGMGSMEWTGGATLQPGFANFSDQFAFGANELSAATGVDPMDALMQITGGFGTAPGFEASYVPDYNDATEFDYSAYY